VAGTTVLAGFPWDFGGIGAMATVLSDCIFWAREVWIVQKNKGKKVRSEVTTDAARASQTS
jgi:hypothetical protein